MQKYRNYLEKFFISFLIFIGISTQQSVACQVKEILPPDLKTYLQSYLSDRIDGRDASLKVSFGSIKSEDRFDNRYVVYVYGKTACGSGGCYLLILDKTKKGFGVVGELPAVRRPIKILTTFSHGYPDISVWVQGGGEVNGFEAKIPFDGSAYPKDPYSFPAVKMAKPQKGRILISQTSKCEYLYQK